LLKKKFDIFEHTADVGIVVYGAGRDELFSNAAYAMFSLITDLDDVTSSERMEIEIEADDLEILLVDWLSRLLFIYETEELIPGEFKVITEDKPLLKAEVYGERLDLNKHKINLLIKGVTYHQLYVKQKDREWEARVIFDI